MNTVPTRPLSSTLPPDVQADIQAVADSLRTGQPLDPALVQRVRERSEKITERIYREYGLLDIGVPAIRELRGELPE